MKLFKYKDYTVTISEEAMILKPFKKIWDRDKSKNKTKALQELGFIYFFTDPRSDYMFLIDKDIRKAKIKEQEGLPDSWEPDETVKEGIELYAYLTQTTASLLLQDTRQAIDNLRETLRTLDLNEKDDKNKPIYTLNTVTSTIKQIPSLSKELMEAERALNKEIEENTRMRGQGVKKLFEDGVFKS